MPGLGGSGIIGSGGVTGVSTGGGSINGAGGSAVGTIGGGGTRVSSLPRYSQGRVRVQSLAQVLSLAVAGATSVRLRGTKAKRQVARINNLSIWIMAEFTIQPITLHRNYI
jgi:hypothetical protein